MIRHRRLYESLGEDSLMQAGKEAVKNWTNSSLKRQLADTEQTVGGTLVFVAQVLGKKFGFELIDCKTTGSRISLVFDTRGQDDIDRDEIKRSILVPLTGSPMLVSARGRDIQDHSSVCACRVWVPENFIELGNGKCYFQCNVLS